MLKRIALASVTLLLLAVAGLVLAASRAGQNLDAPYPAITADTSPEGHRRGAAIFHAMCESCHRASDAPTASGAQLKDLPAFLGTAWSANITSHPEAGIGRFSDAELARVIRFGVTRDGRKSLMGFAMGDADLAAVIGFVRSGDPVFAPSPTVMPKTELSLVGRVLLYTMGQLDVPQRPATGIAIPSRTDKLAYGKYLAHDLFDCAGCHTAGFAADKDQGPDAFAGGFEFSDGAGNTVVSPSLRLSHSDKSAWTSADLSRALRDGLRPGGSPLRYPMPRFRGLEDDEVEALYTYLRSLGSDGQAHPENAVAASAPAPAAGPRVTAGREHEAFVALGCVACHGEGARFRQNFVAARGKPAEQIAEWILRPQQQRPGTQMPGYASVLSRDEAQLLAAWAVAQPATGPAASR